MTKLNQVYKCGVCGNMAEVVHEAAGTLVCCGQDMQYLSENTTDASTEKHVPALERTSDGILVKVGSVAHPMEDKHYIEWIELIADNKTYRQQLKPGEAPEATFKLDANTYTARAYCNLHGLWKQSL